MKLRIRCAVAALVLLVGIAVFAMQDSGGAGTGLGLGRGGRHGAATNEEDEIVLPNGRLQRDEMLKAEHAQNLKDAADLIVLSQQLKTDLEKEDRFILSMSTLKKTDDIERLAKRIRTRLRHY
jgi:hypothetical protein